MKTDKLNKYIEYTDINWHDITLYQSSEFQNLCKDYEFVHAFKNNICWQLFILCCDFDLNFVKEFKEYFMNQKALIKMRFMLSSNPYEQQEYQKILTFLEINNTKKKRKYD